MELHLILLSCCILSFAGIVAALIRIADKIKLISYYEVHRKKWMPDTCRFCLAFWLSCILLAVIFFLGFPVLLIYFAIPFGAAGVATALL